ncbi:Hsp20/alpha crystallin family protein [Aspergillus stella-maris]|uniref:Hsp20/alpha crystallin family protein n=1 Tax=Aspergillus stella-maris TaxID=1810926 RepID=UPI003CCE0D22
MAFFPRYCSGDFTPLFQLLDDYDMHQSTRRPNNKKATSVRTFTPKFDVYELQDSYYLDGELPGVDQSKIEIEFSDPQTLVIKGRSERNYQKQEQHQQLEAEADDRSETSSVKSHQPTVEDWDEMSDAPSTSDAQPTPASTPKNKAPVKKNPEPAYKFWATERLIGEFHRTFTFPTRVDQDSVRASLNNGILSVALPKEPAPQLKKVRVQ